MDRIRWQRQPFDVAAYERRVRVGPCFVCAQVDGHPDYAHPVVYDDGEVIAFLARYPTLVGQCLVAPRRHAESLVDDLGEAGYLRLHRVVYRVARAVAVAVPTERVYVLSLGSQQGNAHVHWHVAPLPPGVPYQRQQFHALMAEHGVLRLDDTHQAAIADAIRRHL